MAIDKVTAAEFQTKIRSGITSRTATHDTSYGPIRDIVIDPIAEVFEDQNDRVRKVSDLLSLLNISTFEDEDLDELVYNEGLVRSQGKQASVMATFSSSNVPSSDLVVFQGYPISSDDGVTFVVTETTTLPVASSSAYFNIDTNKYELSVPMIAVTTGAAGNIGSGRLTGLLRPMVSGFSAVTNTDAATGGGDVETNTQLTERYLLAILGRQMSTALGLERFIRDEYSTVEDVHIVHGTDPLLTRAATDAGAVDSYIIGDQLLTVSPSEVHAYIGLGQLIAVTKTPVRQIVSIVNGANTHVEGDDYEVVFDTSGIAKSTRSVEGIKFLAGGTYSAALTAGDAITITYTYNNLVRTVQAALDEEGSAVLGRDVLVKEATKINVRLSANLTIETGFNAATIQTAVSSAILTFINAFELNDDVEASDIQGEVRKVTGVDNFVITDLNNNTAAASPLVIADLAIGGSEYPRMDALDLLITVV
jgi:uncharacterized phage protein gp47/JayE